MVLIFQELNSSVMVIDEKWLHKEPMPALENVRMWVGPDGGSPEVPLHIISDEKFYIIVACDFRGQHHSDKLPTGEHINANRYVQLLDHANSA